HEAIHFAMARCVQCCEVSAHAGADERHGLALCGPLDDLELARECEVLEIAGGKVRNFEGCAGGSEAAREEAGFVRRRTGGESVQVEDAGHFLMGAGGGSGKSVNLISASAANILKGS